VLNRWLLLGFGLLLVLVTFGWDVALCGVIASAVARAILRIVREHETMRRLAWGLLALGPIVSRDRRLRAGAAMSAIALVAVKCGTFWLRAASAVVLLLLGVSEPALAQCTGPADNTICTPGGNPYTSGINVNTDNTPINVTLQPGVQVIPAGGVANAVNLANTTFPSLANAPATLTANDATINHTLTNGPNQSALRVQASGNATITASGIIDVTGTESTNAIWAIVLSSALGRPVASVIYDGPATGPGITATGTANSTLIQACANDGCLLGGVVDADARIDAAGNLTGVVAPSVPSISLGIGGLFARAGGDGDASVRYRRGTIDVSGTFSGGIFASGASATVTTDPGTTIIVRSLLGERLKPGITVDSFGTAAASQALTANVASEIQMLGTAAADPGPRNNGIGIRASSFFDAPISVFLSDPGSIKTEGGNGIGIAALSGSGSIDVDARGPITATGSSAFGILADSGNIINATIFGDPPGPGGPINVTAPGTISTQGAGSHGIWASSTTAAVRVDATTVLATGQFSTGINAISTGLPAAGENPPTNGGDVTVNVAEDGSVNGGWQVDVAGVGSGLFGLPGLPAAGVILGSIGGTATLINDGSIGALSDRAVAGAAQVINNGTITGFMEFTTGFNDVTNNGVFNLRHFADTNGDQGRDTLRVAVSTLGPGPGNTFANSGTLALLGGPDATTLDSTGQYLPLGNANNAVSLAGPVQGQILGAGTFRNSGVINLQANPVAGDVLVISGGQIPGTSGVGTFVSDGGAMMIDTRLDVGGPTSLSDVLVVDGTATEAGATRLLVRNAGGPGAVTTGNGIPVVEVLDRTRSDTDAFALSQRVAAGPFEYTLHRGSRDPSSPDGNWYLRSTLECTAGSPSPPCPPTPGPTPPEPVPGPPLPNFRAEVSLYPALPASALKFGRTVLDTLHERVGEEEQLRMQMGLVPGGYVNGAWGRLIGERGSVDGADDGIYSEGPSYDWEFGGFQLGMDLYRWQRESGHRDHAGVYGAIGWAETEVDHFDGTKAGTDRFTGYSAGGYWTHFGPNGWYVDAVVQGTWYDAEADSESGQFDLETEGFGIATSLEGGYPFRLGGVWIVEPQAQLIYQWIELDDADDQAAEVRFRDVESLVGRVGCGWRGRGTSASRTRAG
jgi:outer membrane autotransporter protein